MLRVKWLVFIFFGIVHLTFDLKTTSALAATEEEEETTQRNGVFLTNTQLKRLINGNVLRKADIAKVPCIRRSRRCLVESIKHRGWRNQKRLNKILNQILNIKDENKFIDHVLKLMIEDNSDLLKEARNDGADFTKQALQHFEEKHQSSFNKNTRRSELPTDVDFLNTYDNLNDFNENFDEEDKEYNKQNRKINKNKKKNLSRKYDNDNSNEKEISTISSDFKRNVDDDNAILDYFSEEERKYIKEYVSKAPEVNNVNKHSKVNKKSLVEAPSSKQTPYDEDFSIPGEHTDDDNDGENFDGGDIENNENIAEDGSTDGQEQHSEFTDSSSGSTDEGNQLDNIVSKNTENSIGDNQKEASEGNTGDSDKKLINNFIEDQDKMTAFDNDDVDAVHDAEVEQLDFKTDISTGKRRSKLKKTISVRNQTIYDGQEPAPNALAKLKLKAEKHMESMGNIDITKSDKQSNSKEGKSERKHNKHANENNAELDSKEEVAQKMVSRNKDLGDLQDPNSTDNDLNDDPEFERSLETLQSGWDLEKYKEDDEDSGGESDAGDSDSDDSNNAVGINHSRTTSSSNKVHLTKSGKHSSKRHHHHHHKKAHNPYNSTMLNTTHEQDEALDLYDDGTANMQYNYNEFPNNGIPGDPYHNGVYYGTGTNHDTQGVDTGGTDVGHMTGEFQTSTTESSQPKKWKHKKGPTIGLGEPDPTKKGQIKATRVCKPGVSRPFFHGKPNCLIIGDSIALGYSYSVAAALNDTCQVQLSPSSKAGVALDSRYGLQCLSMLLSTVNLLPTYYDVILFNFGLHDIDYLERYPEEAHSLEEYKENLRKIKQRLTKTGATLGFILSTPVTFNGEKDKELNKYNHAAKEVMEEDKDDKLYTVNLHKIVTKECGKAPFANCYMTKKPHDVHYGVTGSIMLGKRVATFIKFLLKKRQMKQQQNLVPEVPVLYSFGKNSTNCPLPGTRCPIGYTCMHNIVSRTGQACCGLKDGIDCGNSWHCCPQDTKCHPGCKDTMCSCIT